MKSVLTPLMLAQMCALFEPDSYKVYVDTNC